MATIILNYYIFGIFVVIGMHFLSDNEGNRPLAKAWKQAMSEDNKEKAGAVMFLMIWPFWAPFVLAKSIGQALRKVSGKK